MKKSTAFRLGRRILPGLLAVLVVCPAVGWAFIVKEKKSRLDEAVFVSPKMRLPAPLTDLDTLQGAPQAAALERFRAEHGRIWKLWLDERRNVAGLLTGGAIPFIPGAANNLKWVDFAPAPCGSQACIPAEKMELLTRDFLEKYRDLLGVDPSELELIRENLGPVEHMYFVSYRQVVNGLPVEGSTVNFRINNGNLIQVATENVAPVNISTVSTISLQLAWEAVLRHIPDFPSPDDVILDRGTLQLLPVTPRGIDPDAFAGPPGAGIGHVLAYRILFERKGVIGRWEVLVDAHTGELLRFVDTNRYGRVHGVIYPGDGHVNPVDRPFAYAHTNLPAPNDYTNLGGGFPGNSACIDLETGRYVHINDACGTGGPGPFCTTDGDADYGMSLGTDCGIPDPDPGAPGNTWSSKTQFYHLTFINIKARSYYPANTWLNNNYVTVNVNQAAWCNATSGSGVINFFQAAGSCWNLGELPGVGLHEWSHMWDDNDGSGYSPTFSP